MSQKKKKDAPKQGELIKLTNGMIDGFLTNPSILKLRQLKGLRAELRFKIFSLYETIWGSPEAKALLDTKNQLAMEHKEAQAKLDEKDRTPLMIDDPKVQELFAMDSGLEVRKPIIPNSQLPSEFTSMDMSNVKWVIEFEE